MTCHYLIDVKLGQLLHLLGFSNRKEMSRLGESINDYPNRVMTLRGLGQLGQLGDKILSDLLLFPQRNFRLLE